MFPAAVRRYVLIGLTNAPDLVDNLLADVAPDAALWDLRPDPARFTLREALAHWADWEEVFLERVLLTRDQDNPTLQGYDEGQMAIDRNYAHSDPHASRRRLREGRAKLLAVFQGLSDEQWDRSGTHTEVGPITLAQQATLILGHDGYHLKQVFDHRRAAENTPTPPTL